MMNGDAASALSTLAVRLDGCGSLWVVGGSTGLALRGADLGRPPRDLDIYADEEDVAVLHERLADYAVDAPSSSRTDRYRSVLSHYSVGGTVVELVGGFEITADHSRYLTEVNGLLHPAGDTCRVGGVGIRVAPLGHELLFNVLRDREDRAQAVGRLMFADRERHYAVLNRLLERNDISDHTKMRVRLFLTSRSDRMKAGME